MKRPQNLSIQAQGPASVTTLIAAPTIFTVLDLEASYGALCFLGVENLSWWADIKGLGLT